MFGWFRRSTAAQRTDYGTPHYPPHPANAPGPFYVEDGCCLSCGVWEEVAPELLAWLPEYSHCYVQRQPETDSEFERMKEAMEIGEVDCIRVHACRPEWIQRLRDAGLGHHIDPPSGPKSRRGGTKHDAIKSDNG